MKPTQAAIVEAIQGFGMDTITLAGPLEAKLAAMKAAGIILRDFSSKPGLDNSIRITIGYQGEMDAVLTVLRDLSNSTPSASNPSAASV